MVKVRNEPILKQLPIPIEIQFFNHCSTKEAIQISECCEVTWIRAVAIQGSNHVTLMARVRPQSFRQNETSCSVRLDC